MDENAASRPAYDSIAHLYDVDMARNMPFDDVGFYARICEREGGSVLEAGCGNGRVFLEIIRRGIDAVGIDCSSRMLEELTGKARERGTPARVCRMDARRLAFAPASFQVVLCPYSLVTYMVTASDLDLLLAEIVRVLLPGGVAVADAFVPQPIADAASFRLDYRRPYGSTILSRSKRIVRLAPGINRVQRRYEITSAAGDLIDCMDTSEDIREFTADELSARLTDCGLAVESMAWDYSAGLAVAKPQFVTLTARKPVARRA